MTDLPNADSLRPDGGEVRVGTGARLHFGLLDTVAPFGGVGVMVAGPKTQICVRQSAKFQCEEFYEARFRPIAERVQSLLGLDQLPACEITVEESSPPHHGLGSGTQLSMAVADGMTSLFKQSISFSELVALADRGKRSAVGVFGFEKGGLIFESSTGQESLNSVQRRVALPSEWRVALFCPKQPAETICGQTEAKQFDQLQPATQATRERMLQIVNQQLLPAGERGEFANFAAATQEYNLCSGRLFESVQGSPYNGQQVADLVAQLTSRGAVGVGQSSWGPTVFAWFESERSATDFCEDLGDVCDITCITAVCNSGRQKQLSNFA